MVKIIPKKTPSGGDEIFIEKLNHLTENPWKGEIFIEG